MIPLILAYLIAGFFFASMAIKLGFIDKEMCLIFGETPTFLIYTVFWPVCILAYAIIYIVSLLLYYPAKALKWWLKKIR